MALCQEEADEVFQLLWQLELDLVSIPFLGFGVLGLGILGLFRVWGPGALGRGPNRLERIRV